MAQSCWCDLFSVKDEWPNLRGALPRIWWFFSSGKCPHILQASDLGSIVLCPCIPLKTKLTLVEKLGCFGRWSGFLFPFIAVPFEKGGYSSTRSRGTVLREKTYSPCWTLEPFSGGVSPMRPPLRSTQQHLGSWRSGPDGFNFFERVAGGEDRCLDPQIPLWEGLKKEGPKYQSSRGILGILEDLGRKMFFWLILHLLFFEDRMFHQGGRIVGCSILKHMHLL